MASTASTSVWWIRRDFRLADNPALRSALDDGAVLPLFVLDPALLSGARSARRAWLAVALRALDEDLRAGGGPGLSVLRGKPWNVVPRVASDARASRVHIAADFGPYGSRRDARVAEALAGEGRELTRTGSPYAVAPGTLTNKSGQPYRVFTPFHRSWLDHGVHDPAPAVRASSADWLAAEDRVDLPETDPDLVDLAGEKAARARWRRWLGRDSEGVSDYPKLHDVPGADATSHLSIALRWGHLHPRTVLQDLATKRSEGARALARQVAWRDFFADVLWANPTATTEPIHAEYATMAVEEPGDSATAARHLRAWQQGRTGFPFVDAGMRQLRAEGWMHNRVRMVVASFLIKDLHIGWWHGADWFMQHLRDGDIAQNQLNWQWVAGCGTDAAPYFRVFNPISQGEKFDPDGRYIRRYVTELAQAPDEHLHRPWETPDGVPAGYLEPIVDHAAERKEALERYQAIKS
ncbi:MAG: DNA photolyase family protein [Microlunatus sp.]|nr:DNA photolyase family protein [Microlunatus sp.]MDN5803970.1 DNA photolyase family protein [Microlunatus sp.]